MMIALRIAFGALAMVAVWVATSAMVRLPWVIDVAIAVVAILAFA